MDIDPKAAGMSAQRLERLTAHLENQYLQPEKIAGCQVLVARRGKIAYFRSLGFADLADRRPIEDDTLFRIYSMTKPITSIALMQLYERGLFQLNDPISRVIPGWRRPNVFLGLSDHGELQVEPATSEITFRQILSHTAGLSYGNGNHPVDKLYAAAGLNDRRQSHLACFVEVLAEIPLYYNTGQAWLYSYASDVCGYLFE
ncbi:MAG: serine hydrolase domain-containing protein, partial [Pseudomonadales bacterium]